MTTTTIDFTEQLQAASQRRFQHPDGSLSEVAFFDVEQLRRSDSSRLGNASEGFAWDDLYSPQEKEQLLLESERLFGHRRASWVEILLRLREEFLAKVFANGEADTIWIRGVPTE